MTKRRPCPPAPGPLEAYAAQFDALFTSLAQRRGFRQYLAGLLLPRDRNKTLTALAGAEPVVEAQHPAVQRLQYFLSESIWNAENVNQQRLALLMADPATAPHQGGVLVLDDSGHRKDGHATANVGRQYLGSVGKIDNGVVIVSTLWADEQVYYPLHVQPYTPARWLPGGANDPDFATKPRIAANLVDQARRAGVKYAAVVADNFYGPSETTTLIDELARANVPYVLALKPHMGIWARENEPHTPIEAAHAAGWRSRRRPGHWRKAQRNFRDGHTETWWAVDATLGGWGPDSSIRLVVATTDPATLPAHSTWYLVTNRPRPHSDRAAGSPIPAADLTEIVRCYGLRIWVEQGYKQVKQELGWADFQVRADTAIRRHLTLVCAAFSFCWRDWLSDPPSTSNTPPATPVGAREGDHPTVYIGYNKAELAARASAHPQLADPSHTAATLLASLVRHAPAA
jgi:SRSO17 transposase